MSFSLVFMKELVYFVKPFTLQGLLRRKIYNSYLKVTATGKNNVI